MYRKYVRIAAGTWGHLLKKKHGCKLPRCYIGKLAVCINLTFLLTST